MDSERGTLSHSSGNKNGPPLEINVLVVDDDATMREKTLGILTSLNYKAEGIKDPLVALERLKEKEGHFDLIVIDLHFPDFDGFKLKHTLDQHFSLPVIMISEEKNEEVIEEALRSGVVRYIVKPATANDFKGIWQFAVSAMKGKKPNGVMLERLQHSAEPSNSSSTMLRRELGKRLLKRKDYVVRTPMNNNNNNNNTASEDNNCKPSSSLTKKTKVVWTNDLQTRFLEAINIIGLHNAVPKKILQVMKTPGLTRDNVASHLQKYRIFLKRVARMFAMVMNNASKKNIILTNLESKYPSLMLKNIQEEFVRIVRHCKMRSTASSNPSSSSFNNLPSFSYEPSLFNANPRNAKVYNPYGSSNTYNNYTNGFNGGFGLTAFDGMNQMEPVGNNGNFDYGYNYSSIMMNDSNHSEGHSATMENILVQPFYEQQQQRQQRQNQISNEDFYQTYAIRDYNDALHVMSHCSPLSGIDCSDNIMEDVLSEFNNQLEQVAGKDINPTEDSNKYFPTFVEVSDELLENINFWESDLEIPQQDLAGGFMESLFNNGL